MDNLIINVGIFLLVLFGFLIYWGRAAGWYKEGGFVYEYFHKRKQSKEKKK